jgi:hypothetical protein
MIDERTAHIRDAIYGAGDGNVDVGKLDDCRFQSVRSAAPTKWLAQIDLGVLGSEYRQGLDSGGYPKIIVTGNGPRPAVCYAFPNGPMCSNNLTLGASGISPMGTGISTPQSTARALRAVQFLQQYCPPARLGF